MFLIVFLLLLGVVRGLGSEQVPWISKEPDLWTLQDAERILWESPWVQEESFRFYNSRRRVRQITYFVRLQSARPVRLALAKAFLSQPENYVVSVDRTDPQKMHELSESFKLEDELVLSLIMSPRFVHTRLNNHSLESLKESSYLLCRGQKISLKGFVRPNQTTFGEAWFRFPRPELNLKSERIRFVTSLEVPYRVSVKVEFNPSKLEFLGELEY